MDQRGPTRSDDIVADLRRRIETGELGAGDRVPSTRQIIRDWGVAMATASRVLTQLGQEGLVHSVVGVGTVVADKQAAGQRSGTAGDGRARRRPAAGNELTEERIAAAAMVVADAEGISAVSMRRVAADLDVSTMTLYRHVADKETLLIAMLNRAFAEVALPELESVAGQSWRERVELAARLMWSVFRAHPWCAAAMSMTRPQPFGSAMVFSEWVLSALDGLPGLHGDTQALFTTYLTVFNYIRGIAINIEMEAEAEATSGLDSEEYLEVQEPKLRQIVGGGDFPIMSRLLATDYDFNLDVLFEFGLQRLLDGIGSACG